MGYSPKLTTYSITKQVSTDKREGKKNSRNKIPNHYGLKLKFSNNTSYRKLTNSQKPNNSQLSFQWIKGEIKKEIKAFLEFSETECTTYPKL